MSATANCISRSATLSLLRLRTTLTLPIFATTCPSPRPTWRAPRREAKSNGVNTNIVQGTQGGFSSSGGGGGGGSSSGATAAGAGGLVTSTLGNGAPINSFDPQVTVRGFVDHTTLGPDQPRPVRGASSKDKYDRTFIQLLAGISAGHKFHGDGLRFSLDHEQCFQHPQSSAHCEFQFHYRPTAAAGLWAGDE